MRHLTPYNIEYLIWQISQLSRSLAAAESNHSRVRALVDEAELNLLRAADLLHTDIICVGCGCSGHRQCETEDGWGCHWLIVDYEKKRGVCSQCPQMLSAWMARQRQSTLSEINAKKPG